MIKYNTLFFFSSRRRHTRFDCDWSSDVCSSDLRIVFAAPEEFTYSLNGRLYLRQVDDPGGKWQKLGGDFDADLSIGFWRSEERRVGKDRKFRWARLS